MLSRAITSDSFSEFLVRYLLGSGLAGPTIKSLTLEPIKSSVGVHMNEVSEGRRWALRLTKSEESHCNQDPS
jgi:hypothetical protein